MMDAKANEAAPVFTNRRRDSFWSATNGLPLLSESAAYGCTCGSKPWRMIPNIWPGRPPGITRAEIRDANDT